MNLSSVFTLSNMGRALAAGAFFFVADFLFNLLSWWRIISSVPLAFTIDYIVALLLLVAAVVFYFSKVEANVPQSIFLGVVIAFCSYILQAIINIYNTLKDLQHILQVGNISIIEACFLVLATVAVAMLIKYFAPSLFRRGT